MKRLLLLVLFCAGSVHGQECIDSDGDGWGWDGSKSCRVTATVPDACDYTNAGASGGWGWNPVSGTSCPPTNNQPASSDSSPFVGVWLCEFEIFYDGRWNVEKGSEIREDGSVTDIFSHRATLNVDGTQVVEQNYRPATGDYVTVRKSTWSFKDWKFQIDNTIFPQVLLSAAGDRFSIYYNDTNRRTCQR